MTDHTVRRYDNELRELAVRITRMGGLCEQALTDAAIALKRQDTGAAMVVIDEDMRIDALERETEELAIQMIARRQPMAGDLREIVAAVKIAADLERIGDLAKNIAKRVVALQDQAQPARIIRGLDHISELALQQLKDVLDAYTRRDADKAVVVWRRDSDLDAVYTSIFRELLTYMMEDPRNITLCTHLLFAAKNVERIGDHATNIAENIHYLVTGETLDTERPKSDESSLTTVSPEGGD
ncbi:MAG: phosphate signaling complex protein PhoU [Rhodobiaceae bacterium]|nr:phosphate signaling complex protein PhoU [Rhodobiaceae bacterium]MCC0042202.1 phosphate signaling complex protein PhoU [Rhodobiaceae bacterium]